MRKLIIIATLVSLFIGYKSQRTYNVEPILAEYRQEYMLYTERRKQEATEAQILAQKQAIKTVAPFRKFLSDQGAKYRDIVLSHITRYFSGADVMAFDNIIKKESSYNPYVVNEIGAGGICQAYPHTKMPCPLDESGLLCQADWCAKYMINRYGSPTNSWQFHLVNNWF